MKTGAPSETKEQPTTRSRLKRILAILGMVLLALLAVILLLGLVPISSRGMASEPDPAASYEEAVARFEQIQQAEQGIVNDLGHSRLLDHGGRTPRAYVLVHGTTNSPEQWQELGETLHARGHNVLILRMPYHGLESHRVSELKQLTAQDLRAYADQAVDIAAGLGDEIVAVGISGGGAVASWMGQNRPEVDRALALAPFFGVHGVPGLAGTLLMNAFSGLPNIAAKHEYEIAVNPFSGEKLAGDSHAPLVYDQDPRADLPDALQEHLIQAIDGSDDRIVAGWLHYGLPRPDLDEE